MFFLFLQSQAEWSSLALPWVTWPILYTIWGRSCSFRSSIPSNPRGQSPSSVISYQKKLSLTTSKSKKNQHIAQHVYVYVHVYTMHLPVQYTVLVFTRRFPLFAKGSEKALFQYAVFLLNKNIAQVNQVPSYSTSMRTITILLNTQCILTWNKYCRLLFTCEGLNIANYVFCHLAITI